MESCWPAVKQESLFTEVDKVLNIDRADWNSAAQSRLRSPGFGEIYRGQKSADAIPRLRDLTFQLVASLLIHVAPLQQRQVTKVLHRPVGRLIGACAGYIKPTNKRRRFLSCRNAELEPVSVAALLLPRQLQRKA